MFRHLSKAIIGSVKCTKKDYPTSHIKIVPYHVVDISALTVLCVFWGNETKDQQHTPHIPYTEDYNSLRPTPNSSAICAKLALRGITCNGKLNSGLSAI